MTVRHPSDTAPLTGLVLNGLNGLNYATEQENPQTPLTGSGQGREEGQLATPFFLRGGHRSIGGNTGRSASRDRFQDGGHDLDTRQSMQLNQTTTGSIVNHTRNNPLVPFVPFAVKSEGNEITARRRSGNTVRSLRSLRFSEGIHVYAREHPSPYILLPERRERREQEGEASTESCDYLVPFALSGEGNEGNEVDAHV